MNGIGLVTILVCLIIKQQQPRYGIGTVNYIAAGIGGLANVKGFNGFYCGELMQSGNQLPKVCFTIGVFQPKINMMDKSTVIINSVCIWVNL